MCQANTADQEHRATHGSKAPAAVVCRRDPMRRVMLGVLLLLTIQWAAIRPAHALDVTVNSTGDEADATPGNSICETAPGNGLCTLRAAIEEVNARGGFVLHTIGFNIPTSDPGCNATTGVCTITPASGLPTITTSVAIDGYTQPRARPNTNGPDAGSNAELKIELNGANAGEAATGLLIRSLDCEVRGLVINRFGGPGIQLLGRDGTRGNVIAGNFIGTDVTGTMARPNAVGIFIREANNTIGGTTPAARNLISGHTLPCSLQGCGHGIFFLTFANENNKVEGNLIGTDVTGTIRLANSVGVGFRQGATRNTIGGETPAARNVISGNGVGIYFDGRAVTQPSSNTVWGNYIGTDVTGQAALGNTRGVVIQQSPSNAIGVSVVGMELRGAGNVISGNRADGIHIVGGLARDNAVRGNRIGTDATGRTGLGNGDEGVQISGAPYNIIGEERLTEQESERTRNVISDNGADGIRIQGTAATGNQVRNNFIGTDVTGTVPLPNESDGVDIRNASGNLIGGDTGAAVDRLGAGNAIRFNRRGVIIRAFDDPATDVIETATGNAILSNLITSDVPAAERGLAIDLGGGGVTPNDPGDADTGPNNRQNFPELSSARRTSGGTTIQGRLNSTPGGTFTVQFFSNRMCNPLTKGLAEHFLSSTTVRTDAAGNAPINVSVPVMVPAGQFIVATAMDDETTDTSELSRCVQVTE